MRRRTTSWILVLAGVIAVVFLRASATEAARLAPSADLQVSMVDSGDPARYVDAHNRSATYTYTITITNIGPDAAAGAKVSFRIGDFGYVNVYGNPVPFSQALGSFTTTQGTCQLGRPLFLNLLFTELHCDLGSLASGSTATVIVAVGAKRYPPLSPGASEVVANSASVSSDTADPDSNNNSTTETTTIVQGYADLALQMTQSPFPATTADDLTFTFVIRNLGPDAPREFFTFTYPIPNDKVAAVQAETTLSCDPFEPTGHVICRFGPLAAGESTSDHDQADARRTGEPLVFRSRRNRVLRRRGVHVRTLRAQPDA